MSLGAQGALNRIAGTDGLAEQGAANAAISRISRIEGAAGYGLRPSGALAETFPRLGSILSGQSVLTSGREHCIAVGLAAGQIITSVSFMSSTQAAVGPTNWWFTLRTSGRVLMAQTADQTSTAWAASTVKTVNLSTPQTITTTGLHYLGIMVAAGTAPSLVCFASLAAANGIVPILNGFGDAALTTTAPSTATALTAQSLTPWAYCS